MVFIFHSYRVYLVFILCFYHVHMVFMSRSYRVHLPFIMCSYHVYMVTGVCIVSNVFKMLMYADDTTLYCNIDQTVDEDTINNELAKIWEWLIANKLSVNTKKTKYVVFHTNQRNVTYPNLIINNSIIKRVSHFNFLGIMLSYNVTLKENFKSDWHFVST